MQHGLTGVFFHPKRLLPYEGRLFFGGEICFGDHVR